jgi:hypothetical protein
VVRFAVFGHHGKGEAVSADQLRAAALLCIVVVLAVRLVRRHRRRP